MGQGDSLGQVDGRHEDTGQREAPAGAGHRVDQPYAAAHQLGPIGRNAFRRVAHVEIGGRARPIHGRVDACPAVAAPDQARIVEALILLEQR